MQNVGGWASGPGGGSASGDVWIASTDDAEGVAQELKMIYFRRDIRKIFLLCFMKLVMRLD